MARDNYIFTSESVSEGHPDKVSDRISDEIVDLFFRRAEQAGMSAWDVRVAAETLTTTNRVIIAGEIRGPVDEAGRPLIETEEIEAAARGAIKDIGYEQDGFHHANAQVDVLLHDQSKHIAQGVDASGNKEEGAGDQGIMFGYASNETEAFMPAPLHYSHAILRELAAKRHSKALDQLGPDSKSQVSVVYENGKPVRVSSIVLSTQHHSEDQTSQDIRAMVEPTIREVLPDGWVTEDTVWHVNPTGIFVIGGPDGDAGLTGRKIIVDTYGGAAPHGGGAFSGKDPTKVDRSAAYAARYLAKNIVAAGLANWATIQLSYAIGVARPLSIYVDTGGQADDAALERAIDNVMDLTPHGIRKHLQLNRAIYAPTAAYGHFGRTPTEEGHFPWERTDLMDELKGRRLSEPEEPEGRAERHFYGRRKGKRLDGRKARLTRELLPELLLDPASERVEQLSSIFPHAPHAVHMEIGFGGGEHLAGRAVAHPELGFIGVEPFQDGMAKMLGRVEDEALSNVRLYDDDAAQLLDWLPDGSVRRLDLLYPDPWPKTRHWKRRFVNAANLARFHRVLAPGGTFRFASDIDTYINWTLQHLHRHGGFRWTATRAEDWRSPWEGWSRTRYEAKAVREGRPPAYLDFRRV